MTVVILEIMSRTRPWVGFGPGIRAEDWSARYDDTGRLHELAGEANGVAHELSFGVGCRRIALDREDLTTELEPLAVR
jgi:hypothetical protein